MIFKQDFPNRRVANKWIWAIVFLISLSGLSYIGLNPHLIKDWWWVLVSYNVVAIIVASYYVFVAVVKLQQDNKDGVVGARFTWSFIKIIPLLTIAPVFSFYMFSFQTVQDNVERSEDTYNNFNKIFLDQVNTLYQGLQVVRDDRYIDFTKVLLQQIEGYSRFQQNPDDYKDKMQIFIQSLIEKKYACLLILKNEKEEVIAEFNQSNTCTVEDNQSLSNKQDFIAFNGEEPKLFQVQMSSHYLDEKLNKKVLNLTAVYATDPHLLRFLAKVKDFYTFASTLTFDVNTSLTQKRFLLDFSSTILLTILSVLLIVFRMIDQLMRPMHNLSLATKEIAKGNYGFVSHGEKENKDIYRLIEQFNEMSVQVQQSRQGLSTHNLYLETILKYSFGVIGLNRNKDIQFINSVIGKILGVKNEQQFVGGLCEGITAKNTYLEPLFFIIQDRFDQGENEWSVEIELALPDRSVILSCQGAVLDVSDKTLGYVIIIQDISKLHRAQKKAAWGGVAVRMAHEIKNPLTPILLSAQRLRNKFLEKLNGKDLEIVDKTTSVIIDQVKSIDAMVSAFADYANTPQIERKLIDLNTLINQTIALYDAQKNVSIEFDLSGDVPELLLDFNSISRVLINLVKNAVEADKEAHDLIVTIATQYLPDERIVRLSIKDNGNGFDGSVLESVFEPYVTTKEKGSGLGMAIVQNIIEQHDGQIFAGNVSPHGAIVTIEFKIGSS
ncbi:Nitrogen regulation protein NtrY [Bathymodiolus thermophilus thioautotrophic gill symbiont]|jgi:nitrogen fixation/metabolism regulation signal transduction histidine kinase|uniref:histidine kinase n=1 Tax=Bathymodiolus thermophilus thioautotrophic gill symbiont TaxID=2360 RepID=A0A1J5UHN0_9GAMM|nr:ATP-binding protein [Bathymodiolus thermophilus thioautotrophic gill symbiont]OIR25405.1 two-component sensor histidine kinase [Bathymodiolus thermophilus thioautotrophic gill symbiont]CAB5500357.1 Two-component system sensor histidine kinase [Bathymodiolus thermophilus thioautotrophic gill symbiont]SGZ73517.1 Nitrogen regulation protein NtrY [Bathymodiolus thermophilus thioautotrophic gill symbiont]